MNARGKQLICISIVKPDMTKIKTIKGKLSERALKMFVRCYGNTLELTKVDVQLDAISALVQFYDPPLRCFTFQNFQLALTLEEFDRFLNFSKEKVYVGIGQTIDVKDLARGLWIPFSDLSPNYKRDGDVQGIKK